MKASWSFAPLMMSTVAWCAELAPADTATAALHARLSRATSRCIVAAELIACADALNLNPNDAALLMAEGDALVRQRRPGEAIGVFRNALRQSAGLIPVKDKIANAEAQRRVLLDICETQEGDAARSACEAAWLPGAPDEATVFKRRGLLLQGSGQLTASLDAYMAAARLRPAERAVAQAIVTLSERTGRDDAATLSAKGQALLTLGHPEAALVPLRHALRLSPDLAEARAHLKIAEREQSDKLAALSAHNDEPPAAPVQPATHYTNAEPLTHSN